MELNPFELDVMKPINEVVTGDVKKWHYEHDYFDLVLSITDKVKWSVSTNRNCYQGDMFFLGFDDNNSIYFLNDGYGSCSGCDELYGCNSLDDFDELRNKLKKRIRKFNNAKEFESWFNEYADLECYSYSDVTEFSEKIKSYSESYIFNGIELIFRGEKL